MSVMDGLRQAAEALRAADKIPEFNMILDAQQKIFDLQNENQELKTKLSEAEDKPKLQFEKGKNWLIDPTLNPSPKLCPRCWDKEGVRHPLRSGTCYTCKVNFS